jgi:hypothetical protein
MVSFNLEGKTMTVDALKETRERVAAVARELADDLARLTLGKELSAYPGYRVDKVITPKPMGVGAWESWLVRASHEDGRSGHWGLNNLLSCATLARMFYDRFSLICPVLYQDELAARMLAPEEFTPLPAEELEEPRRSYHCEQWLKQVEHYEK